MKILAVVAAVALGAVPVHAASSADRSADEAAIRKLYEGYDRAWNAGDAKQLAMVWAADANHVEPDGRMLTGRAAIEKSLATRLSSDLKGTQSKQTIDSIRFLTPDVAAVDAAYELTGAHDAAGNALPPTRGRYVDIWVRRGGRWHIALDRPVTAPRPSQ